MTVVEDIYRDNANRPGVDGDYRTRGVLSLRKAVERKVSEGKIGLIAEFKRQSPSGFSTENLSNTTAYFSSFEKNKIAGFSVLTEPTRFGGAWKDLAESQKFVKPLLSKDFFASEHMISDAYHSGADAILLIAEFLSGETIERLAHKAGEIGMDALIEFHDLESADKIPILDNVLVGYNRRNLRTMKMYGGEMEAAKKFDRKEVPFILESGINSENAKTMDFSPFSGLLIGSSIISGESVIDVLSGRGLL